MIDVSILVITYNQKDFVRETLDSCVNQTFDSNRYEIIVSDDGSTDGTQEIIQEYANKYPNIVPILHEVNTGIASNLNRGLEKVRGKYVALLGGDDLMLTNRLKLQYTFLEDNNIFSGCHANAEVFEYPSNKTIGLFSEMFAGNLNDNVIDIRKMLNPKYQMLPSTFMIRKAAIPSHGFDTRLKILNDYLFDVEVIINGGPFGYISNVVSKYRRHKNNVGNNKSYKKIIFEENLMVLSILEARYPEKFNLIKKRKEYYILVESIKLYSIDKKKSTELCLLAIKNGAYFKGIIVFFTRKFISEYIDNDSKRKILSKIRKMFY